MTRLESCIVEVRALESAEIESRNPEDTKELQRASEEIVGTQKRCLSITMAVLMNTLILFVATLALITAATISHTPQDRALAEIAREERSPLLPLTIAAIPLIVPIATKTALTVAVSGIAYSAMFVTWVFSNGVHAVSRSLDVDDEDSQVGRATRAVRRALSTAEETITGGTPSCRRRIVCEVSRAVSSAIPKHFQPEGFIGAYLRNQSSNRDSYTGAWASGWLKLDCVDLYACDRFSVDRMSSVFRSMGGTNGYIANLFHKYANLTANFVESKTLSVLSSTEAPAIVSTVINSVLSGTQSTTEGLLASFW